MKKIKILGIITMAVLLLIIAVFVILAAFGILKIEMDSERKSEIIFTPLEEKNALFEWQTSETEGDMTVAIKTDAGEILIKLGDCAAAKEFIKLDNSGVFENAEFLTLAENMFIQTGVYGESFETEQTGFASINGAVGFVMDKEKAAPSIVIIIAEKLSGASSAFLKNCGFDEEKTALYEEFGGIPEYEGKIIVFGMVVSGSEIIEKIASGGNSGYTGGYSATEPVKINSVEISYPTEPAE